MQIVYNWVIPRYLEVLNCLIPVSLLIFCKVSSSLSPKVMPLEKQILHGNQITGYRDHVFLRKKHLIISMLLFIILLVFFKWEWNYMLRKILIAWVRDWWGEWLHRNVMKPFLPFECLLYTCESKFIFAIAFEDS